MSEHFLVSLRCLVWLLHHPSAVQSKNQNFSLETLLSEVMRSYFVVPSRADTGVHVCILAMCNESCPRSRALGVIFFSFQNKEIDWERTVTTMPTISHLFLEVVCNFWEKWNVYLHMLSWSQVCLLHIPFSKIDVFTLMLYVCINCCLFFFPFFFFSFLKCTMSGQLWNMRELSR